MEIRECSRSLWDQFRHYHYLNGKLGVVQKCFAAYYQGQPIGFIAYIFSSMSHTYLRVSRLVVLPDYQGIGVAKHLLTVTAEYMHKTTGLNVFLISSNPQLINLRGHPNWLLQRYGHARAGITKFALARGLSQTTSQGRITFTFKFKSTHK